MISKKIVVVGHFGVGKTSLIRRFVEDSFSDDYKVTIGVHILKKTLALNNDEINLIIWDTEGTDDIEDIRKAYLMGTHGFVLVCDLTREATYNNLAAQKQYLTYNFPKTPIISIGNKTDLLPKGSIADAKEKFNYLDALVSAKEGNNVIRAFEKLSKMIIK